MHRRSLLWLLAAGPLTASSLAACGPSRPTASSAGSSSPVPSGDGQTASRSPAVTGSGTVRGGSGAGPARRAAVAEDYRWVTDSRDLSKGFSFIWVRGLTSSKIIDRLGAEELERIYWRQLVGSGDGQRGYANRLFFGVARIDKNWSLIIEDNGMLGTTESLLVPLSKATTVISNYRAPDAQGRLLMLTDEQVDLDLMPLTAAPRRGRRTTELASLITALGLGASTDRQRCTRAAFALTDRLTGVAVTEDLLKETTYLLSSAPRS